MPSAYSDDEINAIAGWMREHLSASQIASRLSTESGREVSRNAIIGLCRRNQRLAAIGLSGGSGGKMVGWKSQPREGKPSVAPWSAKPPRVPKVAKQPKPHPGNIARKKESRSLDPVFVKPKTTVFECRSIPLTELDRGDCKWPVNDAPQGEQHLFCGNAADCGTYCRPHFLRSIGPGTAIERSAHRSLKVEMAA